MSDLTIFSSDFNIQMTSKEIAELVGSRHDKVKQSIDRLANQGVITQPRMGEDSYKDGSGRTVVTKLYIFSGEQGRRDAYIVVVAQLSPQFTARLVDRWRELEGEQPQTTGDALVRMALAYREHERRIMTLEVQQKETKQKIAELIGGEDYATAKGYARTHGLMSDRNFLNKLGRRASAMCRERGIVPGRVNDEVWVR